MKITRGQSKEDGPPGSGVLRPAECGEDPPAARSASAAMARASAKESLHESLLARNNSRQHFDTLRIWQREHHQSLTLLSMKASISQEPGPQLSLGFSAASAYGSTLGCRSSTFDDKRNSRAPGRVTETALQEAPSHGSRQQVSLWGPAGENSFQTTSKRAEHVRPRSQHGHSGPGPRR